MSTFEIVLFNPEIPPNTGNIMRLCSNTACNLHIIEPIGFEIDEKTVRRAGMDYIKNIKTSIYKDINIFLKKNKFGRFFLVSKYGKKKFSEINYQIGDCFIFGSESKGLPEIVINKFKKSDIISIPMATNNRSLNISNAVAVIIYEGLRQNNFQFR